MKYAKIRKKDISNGPGIRATIFVSGCKFNCKGCFNKIAQDFNYGMELTKEIQDQVVSYVNDKNVVGLNILGGEPMQQDSKEMLSFVKKIKKETNKSIWMWSGYKIEDLLKREDKIEILKYIDVLVDGKFELDKKDLMLKYRGSSNQRVIDVKKTLSSNKIVSFAEN